MLKNKKFRDAAWQVAFVSVILAGIALFALTTRANLQEQGLTSGFDFLNNATGWGANFSLIDYKSSDPYRRVILVGFLNSLFVGAISLILANLIGLFFGTIRSSANDTARLIGTVYVEIFRNVPLLLQLLFWYTLLTSLSNPKQATGLFDAIFLTGRGLYFPGMNVDGWAVFAAAVALLVTLGLILWVRNARRFSRLESQRRRRLIRAIWAGWFVLSVVLMWLGRIPDTPLFSMPYLKGLNFRDGIRVPPELLACIVAIAVYGGAYIAEIIRAGLNSVGKGQTEAGYALGLTPWQIFTRIRLPLAVRIVLPTLINQYVWLFKATTIGIAVGFVDFFAVISTSIVQTGQTLELIAILMGGFLLVNYVMAWVLNRVNDAVRLKGNQLRI